VFKPNKVYAPQKKNHTGGQHNDAHDVTPYAHHMTDMTCRSGNPMRLSTFALAAATAGSLLLTPVAHADNKAIATDEMEAYLEFVDYGGGVIFAEQIPKDDWPKFLLIDARDPAQFARGHIPGSVNMDWRQVLAKRNIIPKNKPVLIYCNTGSLSAQAGFALRVAGWDNVRILQGGMTEWQAKGGFDAAAKAAGPAKH
jgi:rhodanese-related sulfurtransferase